MTKTDTFAQIASIDRTAARDGLQEVTPPVLPERQLPADTHDPSAAFSPGPKIDTAEALADELARERQRCQPYLNDEAPTVESGRISFALNNFQWRRETTEDRLNFSRVLDGLGEWAEVRVPHYGGPIGRATAYYRTSFLVSRAMLAKGAVFLRFGAVDYIAQVFVNGRFIGQHEGFFAPFEFECADALHEGENFVVIQVQNDAIYTSNASWGQNESGDKLYAATGLGWEDSEIGWHHCPPGFGIWQPVSVEACSSLHIADVWVRPRGDSGDAEAWIEVWSKERDTRAIGFQFSVFGQNFREEVIRHRHVVPGTRVIPGLGDLQKPTDHQEVSLKAGPGLNRYILPFHIAQPRRWTPQAPWLYQIQVHLLDENGRALDAAKRQFGLRTFRMETASVPRGRFYLNGSEIRLRGANTMGFEQQDVFQGNLEQLIDDILLAKICHMNFWRLTQRPVQPEIYDYADRLGLMLQTDLPLFGCMRYSKSAEGVRQASEMERLIRSHPSSILVSYINEPFPNASGQPHRHLTRPELETFFTACDHAVRVANPDRVIKHVDGDYDPPNASLPDYHCYSGWYNGHGVELGKLHRGYWLPVQPDWNYACGEFGAEGLESIDLMRRRYPQNWLPASDDGPEAARWSPSQIVQAQTGKFHYLWFDTQHTLPDWVRESQRFQAWATRLFTERFRRDNRMVSFAIHLFIDAFPSGWMKTIMDCERRPKPAFFAYREALTPLMVNIRTDRWAYFAGEPMPFEFWICNDTELVARDLRLRWQIERNGTVLLAQQTSADIEAQQSVFQGHLSPVAPRVAARTRFVLRLALTRGNSVLHDTAIEFDVFPRPPSGKELALLTSGSGRGTQLAQELGAWPQAESPQVFVIDDYRQYQKDRARIDRAVAAGATAVFLELPPGRYEIGRNEVVIEEVMMRPRQFVSRATGHRLVTDFAADDFRCWYDPKADCFTPLLCTVISAAGWDSILTSGNGHWGGGWQAADAAVERKDGTGSWRICQVALAGRVTHNPVAAHFAFRLLSP